LSYRVIYADVSKLDVREIVLWYNAHRIGLEDDFLAKLREAVMSLENDPYKYQVYFKEARSVLLKQFPYRVLYKVSEDLITIVGVFHTSQNPKRIRKQVK